jgi:mycothiol synthase
MNSLLNLFNNKRGKQKQLRMKMNFSEFEFSQETSAKPNFNFDYYYPGCESEWIQVLNNSEEFGKWNFERLQNEMLNFLLPNGGVLLKYDEQVIGCSAICRFPEFDPYLVLMYIVILRQFRGQGFGTALLERSIQVAVNTSSPGILLNTDDYRINAIRTYLNIGFLPDYSASANSVKRWEAIFAKL